MRQTHAATWVVVAATATLLLGFAIKNECTFNEWRDHFQYRHYCYSDILPLYYIRHLDVDAVPYRVHPSDDLSDPDLTKRWGFSEYPVLSGYFTLFVAWLTDGMRAYMILTFGLLMACGFVATWALARLGLPTPYMLAWAASPALLVHAYTNWDLLAVALAAGGWLAWKRDRPGLSALLFGLGGAAKLYPAFFLPFLFLERLRDRDRPGTIRTLVGGTVGFGVPNAVAYAGGPEYWWGTWAFHARRHPDFETPWEALRHLLGPVLGLEGDAWRDFVGDFGLASLLLAFASLAVALYFFRRVDALSAGGLVVLVFLLTNRVYSPQYTLWALPILVALRAPWWPLWGYVGADLLNFLVRYPYFTTPAGAPSGAWDERWAPWSRFAVATRWLFLLFLTVALALRMRRRRADA